MGGVTGIMGLFRTDRNWAAFYCRLAIAIIFIPHGMDKLVKYAPFGWEGPQAWAETCSRLLNYSFIPVAYRPVLAQISAWVEVVAAVSCILGLLVRLCIIPLIVNMVVAIAAVQWRNGFWINHTLNGVPAPGFEYQIIIIVICLAILASGAGSLSIDKLVGGEPDYYAEEEYEYDYDYEGDPRR